MFLIKYWSDFSRKKLNLQIPNLQIKSVSVRYETLEHGLKFNPGLVLIEGSSAKTS